MAVLMYPSHMHSEVNEDKDTNHAPLQYVDTTETHSCS